MYRVLRTYNLFTRDILFTIPKKFALESGFTFSTSYLLGKFVLLTQCIALSIKCTSVWRFYNVARQFAGCYNLSVVWFEFFEMEKIQRRTRQGNEESSVPLQSVSSLVDRNNTSRRAIAVNSVILNVIGPPCQVVLSSVTG